MAARHPAAATGDPPQTVTDGHAEAIWAWIAHAPVLWQQAVALNPATPPATLDRIVRHTDHTVRPLVAKNPAAPPQALDRLSRHRYWFVRDDVATHPAAPPDVLARLSRDAEEYTRCSVARNPATPAHIRRRLSDDEHDLVRAAARDGARPVRADPPGCPHDPQTRLDDLPPASVVDLLFARLDELDPDQLRTVLALLDGWAGTSDTLIACAQRLAAHR